MGHWLPWDTFLQVETVAIPRAAVQTAVAAIDRWLKLAGIQPGEPLLRRVRNSGEDRERGLHHRLQARIRDHLLTRDPHLSEQDAAKDAGQFSGHSLRVGFATTAAEAGVTADEIALATRHASLEMPRRYAKCADALRRSPFDRDGMNV